MTFPRKPGSNEIDIDAFFQLPEDLQKAAMMDLYGSGTDSEVELMEKSIELIRAQLSENQIRELEELRQREIVLEKQKQEYTAAFNAKMLKTLDGVTRNDGTLLTESEKRALNDKLAEAEMNLITQFMERQTLDEAQQPKSAAQLEKEEKKRIEKENELLFQANLERNKIRWAAEKEKQQQSNPKTTNKPSKNRGCTIF